MSTWHTRRLAVGIAFLLVATSCSDTASDATSSTTAPESSTASTPIDSTTSTSVPGDHVRSLSEDGCVEPDAPVTPTTSPTSGPTPTSIDLPEGTDSPRELVLVDDHAIVLDLDWEAATNRDGSRVADGSMSRSTLRVRWIEPDGSLAWSTDLGTAAQWNTDGSWPALTFQNGRLRILWPRLDATLPAPTYGDVPWTLVATALDLDGTVTDSVEFPETPEAPPDSDYPGSPIAALSPDGSVVVGRPVADRFQVVAFDADGKVEWSDELPFDTATDSIGSTSLVMTSAGPAASSGGEVVAWNPDGASRWEAETKPAALAPLDVDPDGLDGSLALLYREPGPLWGDDEAFEDYCIVDIDGHVMASARIGWTGVSPRSGWWTADTVTLFSTWVGLGTAQSLVRFSAAGTTAEEIPLGFSGDVVGPGHSRTWPGQGSDG